MDQQAAKGIVGNATNAVGVWRSGRGATGFGQRAWMAWEKAVARLMALSSEYTHDAGMCIMMVKKYKGAGFVCEDGTRIEKGDRIGELHLNNRMVLELTREYGADRAALRTARLARSSLKEIDEALDRRPDLDGVKALVGVTLLHRGLTHGLGFERKRLPSKRFELATSVYLKLLLRFLHPDGLDRSERSKEKLTPVMLVCTRGNLRKLHAKREPRAMDVQSRPASEVAREYSESIL